MVGVGVGLKSAEQSINKLSYLIFVLLHYKQANKYQLISLTTVNYVPSPSRVYRSL